MKSLSLFLLTAALLGAQTPDPDRQTLQTLLSEVQQLRLAIERSTLLGTRIQIAIQRMAMQEARTARLAQDLDRLRRELTDLQLAQPREAERLKELEEEQSQARDPEARKEREAAIKQFKIELEHTATRERQQRVREAETSSQLALEQGRLTDLHQRIDEMERALDAALQHLIRGR
jgi:hypothetical protein